MIMMRLLGLTFSLSLTGWSSASACSILPPAATTEINYEQRLKPYLATTHRKMVDEAHHIVIGSFKSSKGKKSHILKISEVLKSNLVGKPNKRTPVTFKSIGSDRVTYSKRKNIIFHINLDELLNHPIYRPYGIDGTYGPGDCGISLEIATKTNYLIFANEDFEITTMSPLPKTQTLTDAIKKMIDNPQDRFGVSLSIQQVLGRGTELKLLTTETCTPTPRYRTVSASSVEDESNKFSAMPILVFNSDQTKNVYELPREEIEHARNLGLIRGHYTNAPKLSTCNVGQNYLSLGWLGLTDRQNDHGQMIPERSGYFDLSETIFEHYITPPDITFDQVSNILESYQNRQTDAHE